MFSFKKSSHPVAIIRSKNKALEGKVMYIHDNGPHSSKLPDTPDMFDTIQLPTGSFFEHFPNVENRDIHLITGASGSGKSYLAGAYARNFRDLFKSEPEEIILFKPTTQEDIAFKKLKMVQVKLDDSLLSDPITIEDLESKNKPVLVIFDDCESITNKKIRENVKALQDSILMAGRKLEIYCIIINHLMTNYSETRVVLNELSCITLFPHSCSYDGAKYVLTKYMGLNKPQIEHLMSLPTRWCTVYRNFPRFVLYADGAYMLGRDENHPVQARPNKAQLVSKKDIKAKGGKIPVIYNKDSSDESSSSSEED